MDAPGEGLDGAGDADGDRGERVAGQGAGSDAAAEADEEVTALGQLGPGRRGGTGEQGQRRREGYGSAPAGQVNLEGSMWQ